MAIFCNCSGTGDVGPLEGWGPFLTTSQGRALAWHDCFSETYSQHKSMTVQYHKRKNTWHRHFTFVWLGERNTLTKNLTEAHGSKDNSNVCVVDMMLGCGFKMCKCRGLHPWTHRGDQALGQEKTYTNCLQLEDISPSSRNPGFTSTHLNCQWDLGHHTQPHGPKFQMSE